MQGHRSLGKLWREQPEHPAGLILIALWTSLLASLLASLVIPKFYIERNLFGLITPYLLVLGAGTQSLRRPLLSGILLTASAVASLACIWHFRSDQWTVYKPNPDFRAAATFLHQERERATHGPTLVFEFTGGPDSMVYYDKQAQIRSLHDLADPQERNFIYYPIHDGEEYPLVEGVLKHYWVSRFYVLDEGRKHSRQVLEALRRNPAYTPDGEWDFHCVPLYRFRVKSFI